MKTEENNLIPGPWFSASLRRKAWLWLCFVVPYQLAWPYFYARAWWAWHVTTRAVAAERLGRSSNTRPFSSKKLDEGYELSGGVGTVYSAAISPWTSSRWRVGHGWFKAGRSYSMRWRADE